MTKYITACVIVETFVEERSLFVQGERLAALLDQVAACDRETATLEYEMQHLEAENQAFGVAFSNSTARFTVSSRAIYEKNH